MMFTDIHSHILHNIDDGPETIEESLRMLKKAKECNVETIYATPHCFVTHPINEEDIRIRLQELNERNNTGILILYGVELMIENTLPDFIGKNEWVCLGESNKVLIELPMINYPIYVKEVLFQINQMGYRPIIAHPERYMTTQKNIDKFLDDIEDYADLQINAGSLAGAYSRKANKTAKLLIKQSKAAYIASDAHTPRGYSSCKSAYDVYSRIKTKEEADDVFFKNPLSIK